MKDIAARRQLRVAYNSMFRSIFGFHFHESVSDLQAQLERPTWEALVEKRCESFMRALCHSENNVIGRIISLH